MDLRRVVRSDVTIVAMGQLFQQVATLGSGVILAHLLQASGYGIANLLRTLFTGLMTIAPLGLDLALLKYCGRQDVDAPHVLATISRLRLLTAALNTALVLVAGFGFGNALMRDVYHYEHFDIMFVITLAGLPFAADLGIMSAVYKARGRPGAYALMTIYLQPILRLALIGVIVLVAPTVEAAVTITTVQIIASSLTVAAHYHSVTVRRRGSAAEDRTADRPPTFAWRDAQAVLGDSLWMALNLFIYGMMRFVDILMLGYFVPAREVGAYTALSTISQLVQVYPLAASQTLGPTISRQYDANDRAGVRRSLDDYIYLAALISGFMFGGIAIFGVRLDLVFGQSFRFEQGVSLLMPLGYLMSATLAPTGYALSMTGRHRAELVIICVGGLALLVLCRLLIPSLGQDGAAAAVATAFLLVNVTRFAYVAKVLGFVPGRWRDVLPPVLGLLLAYLARNLGDLILPRTFVGLLLECATYAALYAIACQVALFKTGMRRAVAKRLRHTLASLSTRLR